MDDAEIDITPTSLNEQLALADNKEARAAHSELYTVDALTSLTYDGTAASHVYALMHRAMETGAMTAALHGMTHTKAKAIACRLFKMHEYTLLTAFIDAAPVFLPNTISTMRFDQIGARQALNIDRLPKERVVFLERLLAPRSEWLVYRDAQKHLETCLLFAAIELDAPVVHRWLATVRGHIYSTTFDWNAHWAVAVRRDIIVRALIMAALHGRAAIIATARGIPSLAAMLASGMKSSELTTRVYCNDEHADYSYWPTRMSVADAVTSVLLLPEHVAELLECIVVGSMDRPLERAQLLRDMYARGREFRNAAMVVAMYCDIGDYALQMAWAREALAGTVVQHADMLAALVSHKTWSGLRTLEVLTLVHKDVDDAALSSYAYLGAGALAPPIVFTELPLFMFAAMLEHDDNVRAAENAGHSFTHLLSTNITKEDVADNKTMAKAHARLAASRFALHTASSTFIQVAWQHAVWIRTLIEHCLTVPIVSLATSVQNFYDGDERMPLDAMRRVFAYAKLGPCQSTDDIVRCWPTAQDMSPVAEAEYLEYYFAHLTRADAAPTTLEHQFDLAYSRKLATLIAALHARYTSAIPVRGPTG